jgi:hypothetical protein
MHRQLLDNEFFGEVVENEDYQNLTSDLNLYNVSFIVKDINYVDGEYFAHIQICDTTGGEILQDAIENGFCVEFRPRIFTDLNIVAIDAIINYSKNKNYAKTWTKSICK